MAVSAFQKLMNKLLQQFVKVNGRPPQTPKEYMDLQNEAVQFFNKTKGVPAGPKKPPFEGFTPKVIEGGKKIDLSKYDDAALNALVAEDKKLLAEANKLSQAGTNYGRVTEIAARRKEIKEVLEAAQAVPPSGYDNFRADLSLQETGPEVSGIDSLLKSDFEVISGTSKKGKEISEKLGITARPGFPIKESGKADLKLVKTPKRDRPSIRLMKNFEKELTDIDLAKEGYNLQEIDILKRARDVMKKEGQNPDDALAWVRGEMADDAGIEFENFMTDFDWGDFPGKAEGGIARAGFPFGGRALKAIRDAWRANKTWGVGGPPYKPEATSFNIREMTKRNLGQEFTLKELRELSKSPLAPLGGKGHFEDFNKEFKNIKAQILKEKLRESKIHAEAMIDSAEHTIKNANQEFNKAFGPLRDKKKQQDMAKKISDQFTREGKKQLAEAKEGLKEIDIYMGMLQKQGRRVHQSGGLAYMLGEPTYMKAGGGSVGHGPWTTGQVQQQPQQQQQAPRHHAQGQPNPMKMPQGIPSAAPRSMDPRVMQQQMMQKAMMGQQGQQPRRRAAQGGSEEDFIDPNYTPSTLEEIISAIDIKPRASGSFTEGAYGPENEQRTWTDKIGAEATVDLPWGFELKGDYEKRRIKDRLYSPDDEYLDERVREDDDSWGLDLVWKKKFGKGGKKMNQGGLTPKIPEQFLEDLKRKDFHKLLEKQRRWKEDYERRKDLAPTQEAAQGGRIGLMYGGDPGFAFEYGGSWADWHDQHRNQMPVEDYIQTKLPKDRLPFRDSAQTGGRIGFGLGGFNKARRAFLKMLAGITAGGVAAGTGLLKLGTKTAPKVIKEAEVITRGADGMPKYIADLIEVVKAKGTKDIMEGFKKSDYSNVHSYKGVDVIEHPNGATTIKKQHEGGGTYTTDEGVDESFDGITHEIEMEIRPQYDEMIDPDSGVSWYKDADGKKVYEQKIPDEYTEYTARPDMDGKMKDVDEYIDDADHLDLKKIADEVDTLIIKKTKKASGGLAHMLGE